MDTDFKNQNRQDRLCPLISLELGGCYCHDLSSGKIEQAVHYCGGNYRECPQYLLVIR